jgi:tRNA1(Val) A37 N6-methylase TrmN6
MTLSEPEEIYVLDRRVRLLQPPGGFRTSLDSVMLAAACPAGAGAHVLDMGTGVGGAAFCLLARVPGARVTGIEVQPGYHDLAVRNIALNAAEGRAEFACADIRTFQADAPFDHVMCNPPYLDAGTHTRSPDEGRSLALGHDDAAMGVKDWVDAGFRLVKSNGTLTVIHRADMVDKIILALGKRFGAIEIIPLWPRASEAAKRVIVRAIRDRRTPAVVHPGLTLHEADGTYTQAAEAVLRSGAPLFL